MFLKTMSASRIKTWRRCKFAYYLQYALKLDMGTNWGAQHGTAIHSVLEKYAHGDRDWEKNLKEAYLALDERRGTRILEHAKRADYNDTKPKCDKCPFFDNYICGLEDKPVVSLDGCGRLLYGRSKRLLEKYLDEHAYIYDREVLGIEKEFKLDLGGGRIVIGFIDFIYRMDNGVVHMIDYKSNKKYEPAQNFKAIKKDIQAKMYAWAMSQLFPGETLMLTFHFFNNRPITVWYNTAEIEAIREELIGIWDEIVAFEEKNIKRLMDQSGGNGRWLPNECKYLCDADQCRCQWKIFKKKLKSDV